MTDRIPGAPGRCKAVVAGEELQKLRAGEEFAITLRRDDQPIREGTPYSKAAVLPDALAASLCPGMDDPAPKDAFASLYTQKADGVRRMAGKALILRDAAHTPLMGLKIYGQTTEQGNAGDSGSITVTVAGKNLWPLGNEMVSTTTNPSGYVKLYDLPKGIPLTLSADITKYAEDTATNTRVKFICFYTDGTRTDGECVFDYDNVERDGITRRKSATITIDNTKEIKVIECILLDYSSQNGRNAKAENIQIEVGTTATEYEAPVAWQTLTVPTSDGLQSDGAARDEIDFTRGVLLRRVLKQSETPLPDEVMEAYVQLHTYTPTTTIINDAGADMELTYYTHTTAVQMVQGTANKGKTFTVDEHGCVSLTRDNPVIACGETTLNEVTWYYRKWADGWAECWSRFAQSFKTVNEAELGKTRSWQS